MNPFEPFTCDVSGGVAEDIDPNDWFKAFMFGRWPSLQNGDLMPQHSNDFPPGMDTSRLFPTTSSKYTLPDGSVQDIECSVRASVEAQAVECPAPFLLPLEASTDVCVMPCPIAAFSGEEYDTMWVFAILPGIFGFFLNSMLGGTWALGGKKFFQKTPIQMRSCVGIGFIFALVETFPSLFLSTDLACGCTTVECVGESALCGLNRASPYLLMMILNNLVHLLLSLYLDMNQFRKAAKIVKAHPLALPFAMPLLLMIIAYAVEGNDADMPNELLNTARHSFTCSMRFNNMAVEWLLMWFWLSAAATAICFLVFQIWKQINKTMTAVGSSGKSGSGGGGAKDSMADSKKRLCRMAFMAGVLCVTLEVTNIWTSVVLGTWTESSNLWLTCKFERTITRNWAAYEFELEQTVCAADDVTWTRSGCTSGTCRYVPDQAGALAESTQQFAADNGDFATDTDADITLSGESFLTCAEDHLLDYRPCDW
jgi:hypothetical protein